MTNFPIVLQIVGMMVVVLFVVLVTHEAGHVIMARGFGSKLRQVWIGIPLPPVKELMFRGVQIKISPWLLGAAVCLDLDWLRFWQLELVLLAGVGMNLLLAGICVLIGGGELVVFGKGFVDVLVEVVWKGTINEAMFVTIGEYLRGHLWLGILYVASLMVAGVNLMPFPGNDGWNCLVVLVEKGLFKLKANTERIFILLPKVNLWGIRAFTGITMLIVARAFWVMFFR